MDWIIEHWDELLEGAGLLLALVSLIIALTPSTRDDRALRQLMERLSFLKPGNARSRNPLSIPGLKPSGVPERKRTTPPAPPRPPSTLLALLVALSAVYGSLEACGPLTPQEAAQASISSGAEALNAVDEEAAERYTRAAEEALQEAASFDEWRESMEPWDRVEKALRATKAALMTLQAALNVWVATGDKETFLEAVPCFAAEADLLLEAATAAGFGEAVEKLRVVVEIGAAYGDGLCRRGES